MYRYFTSSATMHRNAAVISITCILLCFTFNYTFPLHRENTKENLNMYSNLSRICNNTENTKKLERMKKMTSNLGETLKRFKDSTQDFTKNIQARFNCIKNSFSEEDLRHYEQLVIMKKNPYLDLKDIEQKFSPKNTRQSQKFENGPLPPNPIGDPGIWESFEEGPNVEIINRGLTGFAIPAKVVKNTHLAINKANLTTHKSLEDGLSGKIRK